MIQPNGRSLPGPEPREEEPSRSNGRSNGNGSRYGAPRGAFHPAAHHSASAAPFGLAIAHEPLADVSERLDLLILEDNRADVALVTEELTAAGVDPDCIRTEARLSSAIESLRREPVSLILTDLGLPDAGGLETVRSLKEAAPDIPIVVLTGRDDREVALQAIQLGAQDYFVKGRVDREGLHRAIQYAIERQRVQRTIAHLARHDALTGLPNRISFLSRLQQALASGRRHDSRQAVLYLDLDGFKPVNDSMGHDVGDVVLLESAARMLRAVREVDTVARLGGDEFGILLEDIDDGDAAAVTANRVIRALAEPIHVGGHEALVSCSIGIAIAPDDAEDVEGLVRAADGAMYDAKRRGGSRFAWYSPGPRATSTVTDPVRTALNRDQFRLHYQPQVEVRTGRVVAVEAFLRRRGADREIFHAEHFIGQLERSTYSLAVGEWAVRRAASALLDWQRLGPRAPTRVVLNLSRRELESAHFVFDAIAELERVGLHASNLELDVPESHLAAASTRSIARLAEFRERGGRVTLDDFGIGRYPLVELAEAPLDAIKIDRSVVARLGSSPRTRRLLDGLVAIGRGLDLEVAAEGVETAEQLILLRHVACDRLQGRLIASPSQNPVTLG